MCCGHFSSANVGLPPLPFRLTKVERRIGFNCCKASDKWKSIVSHFQEQFARDSSVLALRRQPQPNPISPHPLSEDEEERLTASVPVRHYSMERRPRSQLYTIVPSGFPPRGPEIATKESVRKVLVMYSKVAC